MERSQQSKLLVEGDRIEDESQEEYEQHSEDDDEEAANLYVPEAHTPEESIDERQKGDIDNQTIQQSGGPMHSAI